MAVRACADAGSQAESSPPAPCRAPAHGFGATVARAHAGLVAWHLEQPRLAGQPPILPAVPT
eukprot:4600274-Lingulodinium_polyedra.AAC.1